MNKIYVYVGLVLGIVFVAVFLPVIQEQIEIVQYNESIETFTATADVATEETVTVDYDPVTLDSVLVESVALTTDDWSVLGKVFTLDADASVATDEIVITYEYEDSATASQIGMLTMIPFLIAVVAVVGLVISIKGRK